MKCKYEDVGTYDKKSVRKHTALLYAAEDSSVASTRYLLSRENKLYIFLERESSQIFVNNISPDLVERWYCFLSVSRNKENMLQYPSMKQHMRCYVINIIHILPMLIDQHYNRLVLMIKWMTPFHKLQTYMIKTHKSPELEGQRHLECQDDIQQYHS